MFVISFQLERLHYIRLIVYLAFIRFIRQRTGVASAFKVQQRLPNEFVFNASCRSPGHDIGPRWQAFRQADIEEIFKKDSKIGARSAGFR